jgi:hypothetical protein
MTIGLTSWEKRETREKGQCYRPPESPLLSIRELVGYIRLCQSTIYERLDQFEVVRLGKRVFVTKRSADAYLEANTRAPTRSPAPPKRRRRSNEQRRAAP